jgi:hypothetical protein
MTAKDVLFVAGVASYVHPGNFQYCLLVNFVLNSDSDFALKTTWQ